MKEFIWRRNHFAVKSVIRNSHRQVLSRFTKEFTQIRNPSAAQCVTRLSQKKQFGYSKNDIKFARVGTFKIHGRIHIYKKPISYSMCDKTVRESATLKVLVKFIDSFKCTGT